MMQANKKYGIVYWSKYGSTEEVARAVAWQLAGESGLFQLENIRAGELNPYEYIIIGSPVYIFKLASPVTRFLDNNLAFLKTKKLIFFILCTMNEQQLGANWIERFIKNSLLENIIHYGYLGGRRCYAQVSDIDKTMLDSGKKMYGDEVMVDDFDSISGQRITAFTDKVKAITTREAISK